MFYYIFADNKGYYQSRLSSTFYSELWTQNLFIWLSTQYFNIYCVKSIISCVMIRNECWIMTWALKIAAELVVSEWSSGYIQLTEQRAPLLTTHVPEQSTRWRAAQTPPSPRARTPCTSARPASLPHCPNVRDIQDTQVRTTSPDGGWANTEHYKRLTARNYPSSHQSGLHKYFFHDFV